MAEFSKLVWLATVRRDTRLGAVERLVISEIGDTANLAGFGAWKTTEQVIEAVGASRATVKRARAAAEKCGYLVPVKYAQGGRNRTVIYNLATPRLEEK